MVNVILIYLPSLLGLILVNYQLWLILKIAKQKKSLAAPFIMAVSLAMLGVLTSWFIVLELAIEFLEFGLSLLSWQISLLPICWALLLIIINRQVRK